MHLLFYYHLACAVTLCVKYPHAGMLSGLGFLFYFQNHVLCVWGSIAGSICAFAATKATQKTIDWKIALVHSLVAFVAFNDLTRNVIDINPLYKLPFIVVFDLLLLPRDLLRTKTLWTQVVSFACLALFASDFKMQLNTMAAASIFLMIMTVLTMRKKKK